MSSLLYIPSVRGLYASGTWPRLESDHLERKSERGRDYAGRGRRRGLGNTINPGAQEEVMVWFSL